MLTYQEYKNIAELLLSADEADVEFAINLVVENQDTIPMVWLFVFFYCTPILKDDPIREIRSAKYYEYSTRVGIDWDEITLSDIDDIYNTVENNIFKEC